MVGGHSKVLGIVITGILAMSYTNCGGSDARDGQVRIQGAELTQLDHVADSLMTTNEIPALGVAVASGTQIVVHRVYGTADIEGGIEAIAGTFFRIASVQKALTATAAIQLAENGSLDLNAPVQRYCDAFPEKRWPVTTRQVLAHLGGLRNYVGPEGRNTSYFPTVGDALKVFAADTLIAQPGDKYSYSSIGYNLVGCVIEGVSGQPYMEFMRAHVFQPAGMTHTRQDDRYALIGPRARGYMRITPGEEEYWPERLRRFMVPGQLYHSEPFDNSIVLAGGSLLSTADDLAKFAIALMHGGLVASVDEMWSQQQTSAGEATGAGLGWFVQPFHGETARLINGSQSGASACLVVLPDADFAVAVLANLWFVDACEAAADVGRIWGHFHS